MVVSSSEIFDLENPDDWYCQVQYYHAGHSEMQIRITRLPAYQSHYYVGFVGVDFYDGPMSWQGANFALGNQDECVNILQKMEGYEDITERDLNDPHFLIVVEPNEKTKNLHRIRIVASSMPTISDKSFNTSLIPM